MTRAKKLCSTTTMKGRITTTMDDLPRCLLMRVFSFLPFRDLLRIGAVCTLWHSLIRSKEFGMLQASTTLVWSRVLLDKPTEPWTEPWDQSWETWFVDGLYEEERRMKRKKRKKRRRRNKEEEEGEKRAIAIPLTRLRGGMEPWLQVWQPWPRLSSAFNIKELPPLHPPFCNSNRRKLLQLEFKVLASAGGLVCGHIQKKKSGYYVVAVGNPLTCKWKKLPPVTKPPVRMQLYCDLDAHMWVDSGSRHYKVALFTQNWGNLNLEYLWKPSWLVIYDSEDDSWKQAPQFDWPTTFQHSRTPCPSIKVPLFLHRPPTPPNQYTFGLAAYDTASNSWDALAEAQLPREPYDWWFLSLRTFPYKDMYLLIAIGVDMDSDSLLSKCWTLDELSNSFKLKSSFSVSLGIRYTSFFLSWVEELIHKPYKFMLEGNVVVIWPDYDQELWPVLAYNMELSTWTMMQDVCHPQFAFETLCALSPSLSAAP